MKNEKNQTESKKSLIFRRIGLDKEWGKPVNKFASNIELFGKKGGND